jgi:hypothetical protein
MNGRDAAAPPVGSQEGGAQHNSTNDNTDNTGPTSSNTSRTVSATAVDYRPAGRRKLPLLIVRVCPFCDGTHAHRGNGGERKAGCGRGIYYVTPRPALAVIR